MTWLSWPSGAPKLGSARLGIAAVLAAEIAVSLVQNGDDAVHDVEGQFRQPLKLLAGNR